MLSKAHQHKIHPMLFILTVPELVVVLQLLWRAIKSVKQNGG